MELLWETLAFAAKGMVVFLTVAASAAVIAILARRREPSEGRIEVRTLNDRFDRLAAGVQRALLKGKDLKRFAKEQNRRRSQRNAAIARAFVLDFKGDVMASATRSLREEVTAVVSTAHAGDEVVLRLESAGGVVHPYGLAASELARLKQAKLKLTVCIDGIAASGGYLMACVADHIIAAPFAVVGSIGVAAPLPNAHRWLEARGLDYEDVTAGEHKRTVSIFGKITPEGREKFQSQIDEVHQLFKTWVHTHRSTLDIDAVATGEHWLGSRALELGLVNELMTSDEYLRRRAEEVTLVEVNYRTAESWRSRLTQAAEGAVERSIGTVLNRLWAGRYTRC